jgi:hypothetical protein
MKLYELQKTFDEMTAQLKELDNCVSPDKNSEHYKTLWDDRSEIKGRLSALLKTKTACCEKPFATEGLTYCSNCGGDGRGIDKTY